jgi:hypothetical protein
MTDKHNVGADSRITATPSTINSTCMLVIGKNAGYRDGLAESTNFAFAVTFTLVNCGPLHTRSGPIVRQANIRLIPAPAPGINERTLPDDAPSAAPHSGSELRCGNGADGRGVRQSHAIMVPDAGAEDFKDPRSRRGASHSRVAPKAVARQQPQELGVV